MTDLNPTQAVLKALTISNLNGSVLQPNFAKQFIVDATAGKALLDEVKYIDMVSDKENIDRVGFDTMILQGPTENTAPSNESLPSFNQNQLSAEEFKAVVPLGDKALRRAVDAPNTEQTVLGMMTNQAGDDMEVVFVFGDKSEYSSGSALKQVDGWIHKADSDQLLYGTGTGKTFDYTKDGVIAMMDAMIEAYPDNYRKNMNQLRFGLAWTEYFNYVKEIGAKSTALGDAALQSGNAPPYMGIPVKYIPSFDNSLGVAQWGRPNCLYNPTNLTYGIFEQITLEAERHAKAGYTDWVLGFEGDAHYVNEEVVSWAFPAATKPV